MPISIFLNLPKFINIYTYIPNSYYGPQKAIRNDKNRKEFSCLLDKVRKPVESDKKLPDDMAHKIMPVAALKEFLSERHWHENRS